MREGREWERQYHEYDATSRVTVERPECAQAIAVCRLHQAGNVPSEASEVAQPRMTAVLKVVVVVAGRQPPRAVGAQADNFPVNDD